MVRTNLILALVVVVSMSGCAKTTVIKNPSACDTGIRYWRPKQYLMVEPGESAGLLKISITQLPDYNEEYSIHIDAGVGTNNTDITLTNGWNLTGINVNVDSKTSELITAATGGIANVAGAFGDADKTAIEVRGHDVPIGLYEAVIGTDANGCKHMYGWRYVGFLPFGGCPTVAAGGPDYHDCNTDIWGIVWTSNKLTMRKISDIKKYAASENPVPAPSNGGGAGAEEEVDDDDAEQAAPAALRLPPTQNRFSHN